MLKNNNKILHISGIFHHIIDDLIFFRKEKNGIIDKLLVGNIDFEEIKDYNIIIFHFIVKIDNKIVNNILNEFPNIKFGFFLHTFYPFCEDGTCLNKIYTQNKYLLNFIKSLSFIIVQDNYSYSFIDKYYNETRQKNIKIFNLKQIIKLERSNFHNAYSNKFKIGFVGSFSYIKGFDLIKKILNISLYLDNLGIEILLYTLEDVGIGKNIIIEETTSKSKKFKNLKIIYNERDRKKIYSEIDCLIIPSIWNETGPMVLYEAFINKIPVIISDQESLKEKVIDRVDSYVFKTGDKRDLLKGILWMKKNYEKVISNKEGFVYNKIENFNIQLNKFLNEL